jgi:hypothetical protein
MSLAKSAASICFLDPRVIPPPGGSVSRLAWAAAPRGRRGGTSPGGHCCGRGLGAVAACGPERRPSMRLVFVVGLTLLICVRFRSRCRALPRSLQCRWCPLDWGNISTSGQHASHTSCTMIDRLLSRSVPVGIAHRSPPARWPTGCCCPRSVPVGAAHRTPPLRRDPLGRLRTIQLRAAGACDAIARN